MTEAEIIRRRILDDAVSRFASSNPDEAGDGRFTTAHYAQALKSEFNIPGPVPDGDICREHLSGMDDVEQEGPCLWRTSVRQAVGTAAPGGTP